MAVLPHRIAIMLDGSPASRAWADGDMLRSPESPWTASAPEGYQDQDGKEANAVVFQGTGTLYHPAKSSRSGLRCACSRGAPLGSADGSAGVHCIVRARLQRAPAFLTVMLCLQLQPAADAAAPSIACLLPFCEAAHAWGALQEAGLQSLWWRFWDQESPG